MPAPIVIAAIAGAAGLLLLASKKKAPIKVRPGIPGGGGGVGASPGDGYPPPRKGIARDPARQVNWNVRPGESPTKITALVFGNDRAKAPGTDKYRFVELIQTNAAKATVGNAANPWSSGYNFASLNPGESLMLPLSWNPWIDQTLVPRGTAEPFPAA